MTKSRKPKEADPWMKFYTRDHQSDHGLRMCGLAARGLWMEMICIMQRAEPYGHLIVNASAISDAQLAGLAAAPIEQVTNLLAELEKAGVFSRTGRGVIYSRRMVRDAKKATKARENGQKGGNPSLGKQTENPGWVNPEVNGVDKPQIPDTRNQTNKNGRGKGKSTPPAKPSSYWFKGAVIRLNERDYRKFQKLSGLEDDAFYRMLSGRDTWFEAQPAHIQASWFLSTEKHLRKKSTTSPNLEHSEAYGT